VGFFECLRDVLIASLIKGQFPAALVATIVLSMIWRMPPADLSKLVSRLFDIAEQKSHVGYVASVVCLAGWFFHARYQRRLIRKLQSNEVGRK